MTKATLKHSIRGLPIVSEHKSMTIVAESIAAGRQGGCWSSIWVLTSGPERKPGPPLGFWNLKKLTTLARSLQQGPPFLILPKQSANSGQTFQIDESMGNMAGGMPAQSGKQPKNIRRLKRLVINVHQSRLLLTPDSVVYIQGLEKMDFFFCTAIIRRWWIPGWFYPNRVKVQKRFMRILGIPEARSLISYVICMWYLELMVLNLKFIQLPFRKIAIFLLILLKNKEGGSGGQLPSEVRTRGSPGASGCAAPPAGLGEHGTLQGVLLTGNTLLNLFPSVTLETEWRRKSFWQWAV